MNFTKPMIDLVREIRKRVPSDDKPSIKLANPNLFNELQPIYRDSSDTILTTLVKELFSLAGEPWDKALAEPGQLPSSTIHKVYRGQTEILEKPDINAPEQEGRKPRGMYRGRPIY